MKYTHEMTSEEIYSLMDASDKIEEGMGINWPSTVYVAIDEGNRVVAVGRYPGSSLGPNDVQMKAIARGCFCPAILRASSLPKEFIKSFNSKLEKSLLERKTSEKKN